MLQINYIRQNIVLVKEKLAVKHFGDLSIVDKLLEMDEQVRKLKAETESLQAGINAASKEIPTPEKTPNKISLRLSGCATSNSINS